LTIEPAKVINSVQVSGGFDVTDDYIIRALRKNNRVITADNLQSVKVMEKKSTSH